MSTNSDQSEKSEANSIPAVPAGAFLLPAQWLDRNDRPCRAVICARDLRWHEFMSIDSFAFRKNAARADSDDLSAPVFYSEEFLRRETLSLAIYWVLDPDTKQVFHNDDKKILQRVPFELLESAWPYYRNQTTVSLTEANALIAATTNYFEGKSAKGYPVPPLVKLVDWMCKGLCTMSKSEFMETSVSELERMEIIKATRARVLGLDGASTTNQAASAVAQRSNHRPFPSHRQNGAQSGVSRGRQQSAPEKRSAQSGRFGGDSGDGSGGSARSAARAAQASLDSQRFEGMSRDAFLSTLPKEVRDAMEQS